MKKIALSMMVALAVITASATPQRGNQRAGTEQRVEQRVKQLDKELDLTDEQESQIKALYTEFFNLKREERKAGMETLNSKIDFLLTDKQKKLFSELKKKDGQKRRRR